MTVFTPEEAKGCFCPFSENALCVAETCILWRWLPLLASDPDYKAAVQKAIGTTPEGSDKKLTIKTAPSWVNASRKDLGLPEAPFRGYCGAGGKPEVI